MRGPKRHQNGVCAYSLLVPKKNTVLFGHIGSMEIFRILQNRHGAEKRYLQTMWQRQSVHDRWQHDRLTTPTEERPRESVRRD